MSEILISKSPCQLLGEVFIGTSLNRCYHFLKLGITFRKEIKDLHVSGEINLDRSLGKGPSKMAQLLGHL